MGEFLMKFKKIANKSKAQITISKKEWQKIGIITGWNTADRKINPDEMPSEFHEFIIPPKETTKDRFIKDIPLAIIPHRKKEKKEIQIPLHIPIPTLPEKEKK